VIQSEVELQRRYRRQLTKSRPRVLAPGASGVCVLIIDRLIAGSDVERLGPPGRPGFGRSLDEGQEQQSRDASRTN